MAEPERLLGRRDIAERLGLSMLTVADMLRAGRITGAFHIGRIWKIREVDLNAYMRAIAEEGAAADAAKRRAKAQRKAAGAKAKP